MAPEPDKEKKGPAPKDKEKKSSLRKDLPIVAHEFTLVELFKEYGIDPASGLSSAQVLESRKKWGENRLKPPVSTPLWIQYLLAFTDFFSLLLLAGGILCFIAYGLDQGDPTNLYLGVVLVAVVFITGTFSFYQQVKSNSIMEGFKNMVPKTCKCIRDGATNILDAGELVPGDVVEFQEGDQVPADIRVIDAYNLKVDNSALTGESEACERGVELIGGEHDPEAGNGLPSEKRKVPPIEASNLAFFSTLVAAGHGKGVVIGTGDNTVMGQIAGLTSESAMTGKPPITREVDRFIFIIAGIAITLGATFLGVGIGLGVMTIIQALVYCISVIVATVPEGLLATLTVALALTAKRMHHKNVLVKSLTSVETLGCTSVIASDKTGTLTQNRMTVQHCWYDDQLHDIPAPRNKPQWTEEVLAKKDVKGPQGWSRYRPDAPTFSMLQRVATLCNNSEFVLQDDSGEEGAGLLDLSVECLKADFNLLMLRCTGDASESGLIKFLELVDEVKAYRTLFPKLFEIKFNSTNKWQLSVHDQTPYTAKQAPGSAPPPPLLVMKGAPEKIIHMCTKILIKGEVLDMTPEWKAKFNVAYEQLGELGERVLGFAYRPLEGYAADYAFAEKPSLNFPNDQLIFAGLFSLMDPPREGVPEAVAECNRASIRVFMVTGDHPITAKAIALQVGIIDQKNIDDGRAVVCTGDDLRDLEEIEDETERIAAWDKVLSHDQVVFARVTPAHKLLIVENNQRRGEVVAVTGDGVNDAPALKRANVGVSMGIAGKDVSKEAADIILIDDNFASIVHGVEEGRLIFDNLKKSICYTLTSKPPELIPFIIWVAADFPLAISTILILAVDLGTDMIPAISLAYESKESDIMSKPPRKTSVDHLVDVKLLIFTYLHFGIIEVCAALYAFIVVLNDYGYPPQMLMGRGLSWSTQQLICTVKENGRVDTCGFGCGFAGNMAANRDLLVGLYPDLATNISQSYYDNSYCSDGCHVPEATAAWDPFVEFTPTGFRGFAAGAQAVCARTCAWYQSLPLDTVAFYVAEAGNQGSEFQYILTPDDVVSFDSLCGLPGAEAFGFQGRGQGDAKSDGPVGGFYWWYAGLQMRPNFNYQKKALETAQTAYFAAVVLTKIVCVLCNKTRTLSLFQQGVMKNKTVLYAIIFEICLVLLIVYAPFLNVVFSTKPLWGAHWFLGLPWALLLFVYDEGRKWSIRKWPGGIADRLTFW